MHDAFPQLEYSKYTLDIPVPDPSMEVESKDIILLCKTFISSQDNLRGDYKEFASLALLYLGDEETLLTKRRKARTLMETVESVDSRKHQLEEAGRISFLP